MHGTQNICSTYFDPDPIVFDGFDYTFGIKQTLVCLQSCSKSIYEIVMEFIQLNFNLAINYPW